MPVENYLIDLSRRLEKDSSDDVTDFVLYRLQQAARHLSRIAANVPREIFEEVQSSLVELTSIFPNAEQNWEPVSSAVGCTGSIGELYNTKSVTPSLESCSSLLERSMSLFRSQVRSA